MFKSSLPRGVLLAAASLAALSTASVALAQTTPPETVAADPGAPPSPNIAAANAASSPGKAPPAASDEGGTIIVTAQRRSERLNDVPITIANLDGQALARAGANTLSDVGKLTPAIRFDQRNEFVLPTIRGVGTSSALAGGGSNVGIYIDGFYAPSLQGADLQLLNVQNVQVLKGPQGTLFGRNTTGGAVLINTAKPSRDTKLSVAATVGSYDTQRYQVYGATGLADAAAIDVAAVFSRGDGFVTNIFNNDHNVGKYKNWTIRAGFALDLSDDLSILLRYTHQSVDDPTSVLQSAYVLDGQPASFAAYQTGAVVATKRGQISANEPLAFRFKGNAYQLTTTWDVGFATITSYTQHRDEISPYHRLSLDYSNRPLLNITVKTTNHTTSQELLVTSKPGSRLQWTVGGFYYNNIEQYPFIGTQVGTGPLNYASNNSSRSISFAGYGDATYEIVDNLFLTGGLRYTHDKVEDAYFQDGTGRTNLPPFTINRLTPRAVIRYAVDNGTSVYGSFSRGYKAAIYNTGARTTIPVKPESLDAYEVGIKHASRRFSANLSGFYYDYRNEQLQSLRIVNNVAQTILTNAASSHIYGIDADMRLELFPDFNIGAGASYLHARYVSFPNAPAFMITPTHLFASVARDVSGGVSLRSPTFTGNVSADYSLDLAGGKLVLGGNVFYTSKIYFDFAEQIPQRGYALLDLRAEWTDPSKRYVLAVTGKNVTSTHYHTQAAGGIYGIGTVWGTPATVEASIRVNF